MLRVDLMSTKISNNKVKQEVTGFFQMNENGEVSYHKLKKQFIKEILEFGIIAPVNGKPTNLFPSDGRIFMEGLRVQYSGSRVRATKPYTVMMKHKELKEVFSSIRLYAEAYEVLETFQKKYSDFIPRGDQKTGIVGEFYSMLYLHKLYPKSHITLGNTSQKGWDIEVSRSIKSSKFFQIKTVSKFSKSRRISPIHYGWDELFLLYLDKNLFPIGFWIIKDKSIVKKDKTLKNKTMPIFGKGNTGSKVFESGDYKLSELLSILLLN